MHPRLILCFITFFVVAHKPSFAQQLKKADKLLHDNLKKHIEYLADDKLEGRQTGSAGEKLAMEYIAQQFKNTGLLPKGTDGYIQPFEIDEGKKIEKETELSINGNKLQVYQDFFPLAFSAEKEVKEEPAIALQEAGMPWFIELGEILEENGSNPHFDLEEYIKKNTRKAAEKGATAIFLYNESDKKDNLSFNKKDNSVPLTIPVLYITPIAAKKYLADPTATLSIVLHVKLGRQKKTGHNVLAYIDNKATTTVVLGAHYDHLGWGQDGNSRHLQKDSAIHNGADDNASGTAALIELGRIVKASKNKNSNYLFIAFSGEELGLLGSKYFTESPTVSLSSINYMINMDMIGRLDESKKTVTIGGYGSSPQWATVINKEDKKNPFVIHLDSSGSGPSDHTSFYRKDIPVLFFFTGAHEDYHRPSDDAISINYRGTTNIVNYISDLITKLNKRNQKLTFTKTREPQMAVSSFKVTLGIMPDYAYSGEGIKVDGVTAGRAAANAGIMVGDIILQIGEIKITTMEKYMQVLNRFNKSETTTIKYKRGSEIKEAPLQF